MSFYIDPHIHMISRTTDDYHRMALSGCTAVSPCGTRTWPHHATSKETWGDKENRRKTELALENGRRWPPGWR